MSANITSGLRKVYPLASQNGARELVARDALDLITILGATAFSALGMWLGTGIAPQQIGLISVIVAPMLFFGCAYRPWRGLDAVPAMKYIVLVHPLVYVADGMRGSLTPEVPHMPLAISMTALLLISVVFWTFGYRSFHKRAIG